MLVDLAVMIADGGEAIADIDVLCHQREVFGSVASDTTVWQLFGGPPAARAAGLDIGTGVVVLDVDSTIVIAHSDKDGAASVRRVESGAPSIEPGVATRRETDRPGRRTASSYEHHSSTNASTGTERQEAPDRLLAGQTPLDLVRPKGLEPLTF
uniref:hypothetical protein n=1 Tax=Micromonospora coriariae TaxID=285665 RepID=UPI001E2B9F92|nr:hypothetical protein [Micromonospora coriariae]